MTGCRAGKALALVVGVLTVALLVRVYPSLVRERRIWQMTGGCGAKRRYP